MFEEKKEFVKSDSGSFEVKIIEAKEEFDPSYWVMITADVLYDKTLKDKAKILFGHITSLTKKEGFCYASNNYLSKVLGVEKETISRLVKDLSDKGYVQTQLIYEGKQVIQRRIYTTQKVNTYCPDDQEGIDQMVKGGIDQKVKVNNTLINSTINNNKTSTKSPSREDLAVKEKSAFRKELIDIYYNFILTKGYTKGLAKQAVFDVAKERKQLDLLLKHFLDKDKFSGFLKACEKNWVVQQNKTQGFLPSILNNQYSKIIIDMNEVKTSQVFDLNGYNY